MIRYSIEEDTSKSTHKHTKYVTYQHHLYRFHQNWGLGYRTKQTLEKFDQVTCNWLLAYFYPPLGWCQILANVTVSKSGPCHPQWQRPTYFCYAV